MGNAGLGGPGGPGGGRGQMTEEERRRARERRQEECKFKKQTDKRNLKIFLSQTAEHLLRDVFKRSRGN